MNVTNTHSEHRDDEGARMGMWFFLFTELMLFGALFVIYGVYRYQYLDHFKEASSHLSTFAGTANTVILLISSLTMVYSIVAMRNGKIGTSIANLLVTVGLGVFFLVNKYFEWSHKIADEIYPSSGLLADMDKGEMLFYALYYCMTGIHALHIILGIGLLLYVYWKINKGRIDPGNYVFLENSGLYWHLVDVIWIFLFPLFYLIG